MFFSDVKQNVIFAPELFATADMSDAKFPEAISVLDGNGGISKFLNPGGVLFTLAMFEESFCRRQEVQDGLKVPLQEKFQGVRNIYDTR